MNEKLPKPANDNVDRRLRKDVAHDGNVFDFAVARQRSNVPEVVSKLASAREQVRNLARQHHLDHVDLVLLEEAERTLAAIQEFGAEIQKRQRQGIEEKPQTLDQFYDEAIDALATVPTEKKLRSIDGKRSAQRFE